MFGPINNTLWELKTHSSSVSNLKLPLQVHLPNLLVTHHNSCLTYPPFIPADSPQLLTYPPFIPADSHQLLTDIPPPPPSQLTHRSSLLTSPPPPSPQMTHHSSLLIYLPFIPTESQLTHHSSLLIYPPTSPPPLLPQPTHHKSLLTHTHSSSQPTHHSSLLTSPPPVIPTDSPELLTDIPPPPLTPADSLQLFTNISPPPPLHPRWLTTAPYWYTTLCSNWLTTAPYWHPPPPPSSQLTHHSSLPTSPPHPHPSRLTTTPYWHTHPSSQLTHHSFLLTFPPPLLPQPTHHNSLLTCPPFIPANSPQLLTDTLTLHPSWLTTARYWHTHPLSQLTHQPGSEKVSTPSCGGSNLCEGYIRDGHVVWYAIVHSGISSQLQKGVVDVREDVNIEDGAEEH